MVETLSKLVDILPILKELVNLGLSIVLSFLLIAILVYGLYELNKTIKNNTDALTALKSTLENYKAEVDSMRMTITDTRDKLNSNTERSKHIKEIIANNYVILVGIQRDMATRSEIDDLRKELILMGKGIAQVCGKLD